MPEKSVITSLVGVAAPLLTCDTSQPDYIVQDSPWVPRDWYKSTPFVRDELILQPTNSSKLGVELQFELPKLASVVSNICLRTVVPAHTVVPAAPAYFTDAPGFAIIEYFHTNFGSNQVYTTQDIDLYIRFSKFQEYEDQLAISATTFADTTTAQRSALLLNGDADGLYTPLWQPLDMDTSTALPLVVLSQKTRFLLKTRPLANIVYNPSASVITPAQDYDFTLLLEVIHTTGDESNFLLMMSQQSNGIAYMIHQHVRQDSGQYANTQNGFQIIDKMSGITKPIMVIYWALIPSRLRNNTGFNDFYMFAPQPVPLPPGMNTYNPVQSWSIEANGQIVQRTINRKYNIFYQHYRKHKSLAGEDIFFQDYTSAGPTLCNAATGYLDYTNLNNATLRVTLGTGGTGLDPINVGQPQQLTVIYNALDYNFHYFHSGNWTRAFN